MPELPEVETVVRELRPQLVGRRVAAIRASRHRLRQPWSRTWNSRLLGRTVVSLDRRGKWILVRLDDDKQLVIHLGMTGQLRVHPASERAEPHTHLLFRLDNGEEELRFCDIRRFGGATLFGDTKELAEFFQDKKLGPEPFDLDPPYWRQSLAGTSRCLKAILLDQSVVAGVGNIYADESLFEARLHPARLGKDTARAEADRLRRAIGRVLNRAIERRGSSIRNYVGGSGLRGEYQNEFRVYGLDGQPCQRCARELQSCRLAGRSTHFCPACQLPPESD